MESALSVVEVYNSDIEAELARGRLENAGIEAMISSDDSGGALPQFQAIRGVKLRVRKEDLERAKAVLAE